MVLLMFNCYIVDGGLVLDCCSLETVLLLVLVLVVVPNDRWERSYGDTTQILVVVFVVFVVLVVLVLP